MILRRCWERVSDIVAMSQTGGFLLMEGGTGTREDDRSRKRNTRNINGAMQRSRQRLHDGRKASPMVDQWGLSLLQPLCNAGEDVTNFGGSMKKRKMRKVISYEQLDSPPWAA
jgi:hypothetical protein